MVKKTDKPQKIMVIGPAASNIGHNGELDAFTVQALDEFCQASIRTVLVSPNSALVSSDPSRADRTYTEPLLPRTIVEIASLEKPDAIYVSCGGRQGLGLVEAALAAGQGSAIEHMPILGLDGRQSSCLTDPVSFSRLAAELGLPVPERIAIDSEQQLFEAAGKLGFPFFVRFSHSEDGAGGRIIYNREELHRTAEQAFDKPPAQALIAEKSLENRQELDLVVLRDRGDGFSPLGVIEQLDPVGIHFLDSCWTWPAPTVNGDLLAEMETAARAVCRKLGLLGVVTAKFAFNRSSGKLLILGVSACLDSRASFLERALSLPLGRADAGLALGKSIAQGRTPEARPAAAKSAVRLPRWDLQRFQPAADCLTARCRSTGACLGLGDTFADAFGHAMASVRAYEISPRQLPGSGSRLMELLGSRTTGRYQLLQEAVRRSTDPVKLADTTGIDPYFIRQMESLPAVTGNETRPVHWRPGGRRHKDTQPAAGRQEPGVLFVGPGPFRIGYGPAGEASLYKALEAAAELGLRPALLNSNPDGLSTCPDGPALVGWAPASSKALMTALEDRPRATLICQFGGRAAMRAVKALADAGNLPAPSWLETVNLTADKTAFRKAMRRMGIPQVETGLARNGSEIDLLVEQTGLPLAFTSAKALAEPDTELILDEAMLRNRKAALAARAESNGMIVESFLEYAIEVNADAVSDGKDVLAPLIFEQVELAGVHASDSCLAAPPYSIAERHVETIEAYIRIAARELNIVGPFNIRLAIYRDTVYLLEVQPWASPTLPLTSKLCGLDLAGLAAKILLGRKLADLDARPRRPAVRAVRTAVFPFNVFTETDPLPGPLARSTGEVLGLAGDFGAAYFKSNLAGRMPLPTSGGVLITVTDEDKASVLEPARLLRSMGFTIKATRGTCRFLANHGIAAELVRKLGFGRPNLVDEIKNRKVQIIINTPSGGQSQRDDALIRRTAMAYGVVTLTAPAAAIAAARGIATAVEGREKLIALQDWLTE